MADRPPFRHSEHSDRQRLWTNLKFEGWTVRTPWANRLPFISCNPPEVKSSLDNFSTDLRTVRTPGADRPPFTLKTHERPNTSLVKLLSNLRTVRSPWPDSPQSNLSAQARETTSLDDFFKTPADCPHLRGGLSAVWPSSPNRAATSLDKKMNHTSGPSAQQGRTVRPSLLFPTS